MSFLIEECAKETPGLWWACPGVEAEIEQEAGSFNLGVDDVALQYKTHSTVHSTRRAVVHCVVSSCTDFNCSVALASRSSAGGPINDHSVTVARSVHSIRLLTIPI